MDAGLRRFRQAVLSVKNGPFLRPNPKNRTSRVWIRVPNEFIKEITMESKGIHKDYPGHEITRFSSCRGFVFSAFLHGRRGRGLAVEPVTSNRISTVAGQARQHAAADICADKLTLYKSSPRAAQRRIFFLQKIHAKRRI